MKKLTLYFKIILWIISAVILFLSTSGNASFKGFLYHLTEGLLIVSTYYGIFLLYTNSNFKNKYGKIFSVFALIMTLISQALRIIYLAEAGSDELKPVHFFRVSLFQHTLIVFGNSVLFGLAVCGLIWLFRQPRRKMIRITGISIAVLSTILASCYVYMNRDLGEQEIYFNYDINTLSEVQGFAKSEQKTIYLDFWHSGCRPCLQEFEQHDKFRKLVNKDHVHFMFIGTDRSVPGEKLKQRALIEKYDLKGTHSFVSREQFSRILDQAGYDMNIHGMKAFPHHMIIGPDGTIIKIKAGKPTEELAARLNSIK